MSELERATTKLLDALSYPMTGRWLARHLAIWRKGGAKTNQERAIMDGSILYDTLMEVTALVKWKQT